MMNCGLNQYSLLMGRTGLVFASVGLKSTRVHLTRPVSGQGLAITCGALPCSPRSARSLAPIRLAVVSRAPPSTQLDIRGGDCSAPTATQKGDNLTASCTNWADLHPAATAEVVAAMAD